MGLLDFIRRPPDESARAAAPAAEVDDDRLAGRWRIDPDRSTLGFSARYAMVITVNGRFTSFEGGGVLDPGRPEVSSAEVVIDAASVDTGVADRDAHLRSSDFFGVRRHPRLSFTSTLVERVPPAIWRVTGDLSVREVTRPVTVDFVLTGLELDPDGRPRAAFSGSTSIDRKDWGLTWNAALETGGFLVSDKVVLEFEISAIKAA